MWIEAKNHNPPKNLDVLIFNQETNQRETGYLDKNNHWHSYVSLDCCVTHWQEMEDAPT